jgi:hypothetical protein
MLLAYKSGNVFFGGTLPKKSSWRPRRQATCNLLWNLEQRRAL